jgi:hypothetical protein
VDARMLVDECSSMNACRECLLLSVCRWAGPSYVVVDGRVLLKEASISVASQAPGHQHDRRPGAHWANDDEPMGRLTSSRVIAFEDRSQWRVVALDVSLRRRRAFACESYRFTVWSVWDASSRRATMDTLHVCCCSVRICAIEFIGRNSRQSNGRTRFAMITYTYNSNISHSASQEHPSTCVETPSSLGRHVRYG